MKNNIVGGRRKRNNLMATRQLRTQMKIEDFRDLPQSFPRGFVARKK